MEKTDWDQIDMKEDSWSNIVSPVAFCCRCKQDSEYFSFTFIWKLSLMQFCAEMNFEKSHLSLVRMSFILSKLSCDKAGGISSCTHRSVSGRLLMNVSDKLNRFWCVYIFPLKIEKKYVFSILYKDLNLYSWPLPPRWVDG